MVFSAEIFTACVIQISSLPSQSALLNTFYFYIFLSWSNIIIYTFIYLSPVSFHLSLLPYERIFTDKEN